MNKSLGDQKRHASSFHEILFSLNIGFAIAILLRVYLSRFGPGQNEFVDYALRMIGWINGILHLRPRNQAGVELMFLIFVFIFSSIIILLQAVTMPANARRLVLRAVGGVMALAAVPTCLLYAYLALRAGTVTWPERFVDQNKAYLILETAAAVACFVLYLSRKWPISDWVTVALVTLHYALWGWVIFQLFAPAFWASILSTVPFCSGLAWMLYARHLPTLNTNEV
jgi:hypothetical protein